MTRRRTPDPKLLALRQQGCLYPRAQSVCDLVFAASDFFDPRDLVQVKYEMLRRVQVEGQPVGHTTAAFGFSRPTFYQAQAAFAEEGLSGLIPKKRGPREAHKLRQEVLEFLEQELNEDRSLRSAALAKRVQQRFGVSIHPRSIERALTRSQKKRS